MMNLPSSWQIPEGLRSRIGNSSGQQRAMVEDGHLLLVLHKLPHHGRALREGVLFWCDAEGDWKPAGNGAGLGALKSHLDEYQNAIDGLTANLDRAQDATALYHVLESAVPIHRAAKNQHAAMQDARDALPDRRELVTLRDTTSDIDRASELLEIDARNALNYHIARQNEEQNRLTLDMARAGHRLNFMAMLFLPLTAVTSVFGMNLPNGLENASPWLFWSVLVFGLLLGFILRGFFAATHREQK